MRLLGRRQIFEVYLDGLLSAGMAVDRSRCQQGRKMIISCRRHVHHHHQHHGHGIELPKSAKTDATAIAISDIETMKRQWWLGMRVAAVSPHVIMPPSMT